MTNLIKEYREAANLTQEQLGKHVTNPRTGKPIGRSGINKIENKEMSGLTVRQVKELSSALKLHPCDFLDCEKPEKKLRHEDLLELSTEAIQSAARDLKLHLTLEQAMAFSVELYKHILKYRQKEIDIVPNQAIAELILRAS